MTKIDDDGFSYTMDLYVKKGEVEAPPEPTHRRTRKEKSRYEHKTAWMALMTGEDSEDDDEAEGTFTRQQS